MTISVPFYKAISKIVTVHAENKAFLCHCEAFRPKQSQKRTILDCFASLAMTKMRFSRERLPKIKHQNCGIAANLS